MDLKLLDSEELINNNGTALDSNKTFFCKSHETANIKKNIIYIGLSISPIYGNFLLTYFVYFRIECDRNVSFVKTKKTKKLKNSTVMDNLS